MSDSTGQTMARPSRECDGGRRVLARERGWGERGVGARILHFRRAVALGAIATWIVSAWGNQSGGQHISVKAYLAHEAVKAGGESEVAIEVSITPGWHIYHRVVLDTGAPTALTFEGAAELQFGEVRFPRPEEGEAAGLKYLELAGKPVFIVPVKVSDRAAAGSTLAATIKVRALVCKELCVFNDATVSIDVPVGKEMGKAANEGFFREARKRLSPLLADAPRIRGSELVFSQDKVRVGDTIELAAVIQIEKGSHVQDRDPGVEGLIPTRVWVEAFNGFESAADSKIHPGGQIWPEAKAVEIKGFGTVRQQEGRFVVRVPMKFVDDQAKPGVVTMHALVSYQVCTESGQCFAPEIAEGAATIEIAPPGTPVTRSEHFAFTGKGSPTTNIAAAKDGSWSKPTVSGESGSVTGGMAGTEGGRGGAAPAGGGAGLWWWYLLALAGGAVLNIMPCVLPVISLKIFSFMRQGGEDRGRVFMMGLVYCAGIMVSFLILSLVMVGIRAATGGVAWGTLMQQPAYVIGLAAVMCAFAMSLFGVYEITLPGSAMNAMGEATTREGFAGSFFNGVLATALATPCTAPMLGPALGVLTQLSAPTMVAGILTVGAGMSMPYLLLTAFPAWLRFMPKPGNWMIGFKQLMGFLLLGTVVWLFYILVYLTGPLTTVATIAFLAFVSMACWLYGTLDVNASPIRRIATLLAMVAILGGGGCFSYGWLAAEERETEWSSRRVNVEESQLAGIAEDIIRRVATATTQPAPTPLKTTWFEWQRGLPELLSRRGYTVFVDFTGRYCLTCQVNKKVVVQTDPIVRKFHEYGVVCLVADFTQSDPVIQQELNRFDRAGVPVNLLYAPNKPDSPHIFPEVLTQGMILEQLEAAGASKFRGGA